VKGQASQRRTRDDGAVGTNSKSKYQKYTPTNKNLKMKYPINDSSGEGASFTASNKR
jgi:hypothetical protein